MQKKLTTKKHLPHILLVAVWLLFLAISFTQDTSAAVQKYDIAVWQLRLIQMVISIPQLLVWSFILYAVMSFYRYSKAIIDSHDGKAARFIAYSMSASLLSMIGSSALSQVRSLVKNQGPTLGLTVDSTTIVSNYFSVVMSLVIYGLLLMSAVYFLRSIKNRLNIRKIMTWGGAMALLVGLVYGYFVFVNVDRTIATTQGATATYALPDILIFSTVVVPYVVSWLMAFAALLGFRQFIRQTKGIIYKQLFKNFSIGIWTIVVLSICLQILTQFSAYLANAGLDIILLLIAVILVAIVVGYFLVGKAARQLQRIEEVGA